MSTSFFVVPSFAPPTLEQLASEPDDVAIIVRQEAKITQQVGAGRARARRSALYRCSRHLWPSTHLPQLATATALPLFNRCSWRRCESITARRSRWA